MHAMGATKIAAAAAAMLAKSHAGCSGEKRPGNPQLHYPVDQRGALQPQLGSCTGWSADHPAHRHQCLQNQSAFGVFQSSCGWRDDDTLSPCCWQRIWEHAIVGKDHGTFDQVL